MPGCANAFADRGRIVKMDNRDSDDLILDPRFFNSLLETQRRYYHPRRFE